MSWQAAAQPAIRRAEEGFEFDAEHERHFARCASKFDEQSTSSLFEGGAVPKLGDTWRQQDLADLLHQLADDGPDSFYNGPIAESIVSYVGERDGILTVEDFRCYRPQVDVPIVASCRNFTLH